MRDLKARSEVFSTTALVEKNEFHKAFVFSLVSLSVRAVLHSACSTVTWISKVPVQKRQRNNTAKGFLRMNPCRTIQRPLAFPHAFWPKFVWRDFAWLPWELDLHCKVFDQNTYILRIMAHPTVLARGLVPVLGHFFGLRVMGLMGFLVSPQKRC